jgi:hypothetical protein
MKKYFLSTMAVILAIGFSAFTAPKKPLETSQALYWYYVNSDMVTVEHTNRVSTSQIEKSDAQAIVTCEGNTLNDCARGFNQVLTSSTTSSGLEQIKRNQ